MKSKNLRSTLLAAIVAVLVLCNGQGLLAQNGAEPKLPAGHPPVQGHPGMNGGMGGGKSSSPHQFDPVQMQEMMLTRLKERLAASDQEWKTIEPLLSNVLKTQMDVQRGRLGNMGRRGPGVETNTEADALQSAVENATTPDAAIKTKLAAYREAQQKKETALKNAREKLRAALTARQEAKLVLTGILE